METADDARCLELCLGTIANLAATIAERPTERSAALELATAAFVQRWRPNVLAEAARLLCGLRAAGYAVRGDEVAEKIAVVLSCSGDPDALCRTCELALALGPGEVPVVDLSAAAVANLVAPADTRDMLSDHRPAGSTASGLCFALRVAEVFFAPGAGADAAAAAAAAAAAVLAQDHGYPALAAATRLLEACELVPGPPLSIEVLETMAGSACDAIAEGCGPFLRVLARCANGLSGPSVEECFSGEATLIARAVAVAPEAAVARFLRDCPAVARALAEVRGRGTKRGWS